MAMLGGIFDLSAAQGLRNRKRSQTVLPIDEADTFFGMPDLFNQIQESKHPTQCVNGCLALRVPDPPTSAPPAIVNISKDGKIAAVGGKDVELFLWSTETGELLSTLRGHETSWTGSNDNTFFVTTQEDSKVVVWDQQQIQQRLLLGHPEEALTCCSISLDDEFVVVGGMEGSLYSWDVRTGEMNHKYYGGHESPVVTLMCFRMTDASHVIISCGRDDHRIVVWDLETAKHLYALEVTELKVRKNLKFYISKEQIQVLIWSTDIMDDPEAKNLVYLDPLTGERRSIRCHEGQIKSAIFMKEASNIVTCGQDGKVVVWDTNSFEPRLTLEGHVGPVLSCGVNEEGTRIVTGGEDCKIRVWNAEDGKPIRTMMAQSDPIKFCQYAKSTNETKIITCDVAGRVYVWSTVVEVLNSLLRRFADDLSCVTTSNDSSLIAAGCSNGRVMLWDANARVNLWEYTHHTGRVEAITFNTLRETIATCGADGRVVVMSVMNGKQLKLFCGSSEPVTQICFSPDDDRLAGVTEGKVMVFKADQPECVPALSLYTGAGKVVACTWSPNSRTVLGSCADGSVLVWSASTGSVFSALNGNAATTCLTVDMVGKVLAVGNVLGRTMIYMLETSENLCELRSNAAAVREVAFNQDTTRLTTVCSRQAIIWDLATASQLRLFDFVVDRDNTLFCSVPDPVRAAYCHWGTVLFDHESETATFDMVPFADPLLRSYYLSELRGIVSGNAGVRRIMMWSGADHPVPDKLHTTHDAITSCHFSGEDRLLAVGTQDGSVIVYDAPHNDMLEVIQAHMNGPCKCVRFSFDGRHVLSSGADGQVILWDWRDQEAVHHYEGHLVSVECCDLSLHGGRVASGDCGGTICVFNIETASLVLTLNMAHPDGVLSLSISADGSTVASIGAEGKVSMWHVEMGAELMTLGSAVFSKPLFCSFSSNDSKLAITGTDGSIMVWNLVAGCQWYMIQDAHQGASTSCAWSFNSRHLVTAGADSVVALWDSESGAPLFNVPVKTGCLTTCSISPNSIFLATGSVSGTLSIHSIPSVMKEMPEPSFLYSWVDMYDYKDMVLLLKRLFKEWPYLYNVQDAQGWSLIGNAVANGNSKVCSVLMEALETLSNCTVGLVSAVPSSQLSRIVLDHTDEDYFAGDNYYANGGIPDIAKQVASVAKSGSSMMFNPGAPSFKQRKESEALGGFEDTKHRRGSKAKEAAARRKRRRGKGNQVQPVDDMSELEAFNESNAMERAKSFNVQAKKATVEVLLEKRDLDGTELNSNNILAMALNSKSSKCVQVVLDMVVAKRISFGSYHAITDMMRELSSRYPFMCYRFLEDLDLMPLGSLEVPVGVMKNSTSSLIRTAPIFTNVKELWSGVAKSAEAEHGPQPYQHVKANMVRLPYASAVGPGSLLHCLVDSDVPVQAFGSPTIQTVISHKWRLYGRNQILLRSVLYLIYALVLTVFAILYAKEDHSLTLPEYWDSGAQGRFHIIASAYLIVQALWYLFMETRQLWAVRSADYYKSGWNTLDIASMLMMVAIGILELTRTGTLPSRSDRVVAPMIAFTLVLTYFKIFFYALAFEPTGPVVHLFFRLSLAVQNWVVLMFMNIVSFGTALQVLSQLTYADDQYTNFGRSLYTLWQSLFGQFDLSHMLADGAWQQVSIVIFSLWLFVSNIVMLNMLIVMMLGIYKEVRNKNKDEFLRGRAELIMEVETLMTAKERERHSMTPPFLHLLSQVQRNFHSLNSLIGRLRRTEEFMGAMHQVLTDLVIEIGRRQGGTFGWNTSCALPQLPEPGDDKPSGPPDKDPSHPGGPDVGGGHAVATMTVKERMVLMQLMVQRVRDTETQLPAVMRQVERLERSVYNQEIRMESMVNIMRNLEDMLRNQRPTTIQTASPVRRPKAAARLNKMTEADLEREVRRLLGGGDAPATSRGLPLPPAAVHAHDSAGKSSGSSRFPGVENVGPTAKREDSAHVWNASGAGLAARREGSAHAAAGTGGAGLAANRSDSAETGGRADGYSGGTDIGEAMVGSNGVRAAEGGQTDDHLPSPFGLSPQQHSGGGYTHSNPQKGSLKASRPRMVRAQPRGPPTIPEAYSQELKSAASAAQILQRPSAKDPHEPDSSSSHQ